MSTGDGKAFQERLQRIDLLIHDFRSLANPPLQASVEELIQLLLELHGTGLERMLDIIWETGEAGERIIHRDLSGDELVSNLLLLHNLHPHSLEDRIQQALDKVRPYLRSHGGNVEVVDIQDGTVRLRLQGSCQSCPASAMTLKYAVEDAIYKVAPDVVEVVAVGVEERPPTTGFIPLEQLLTVNGGSTNGPSERSNWHDVNGLTPLHERDIRSGEVAGHAVLLCRLGENIYAYGNACPHCGQGLGAAGLEGTTLICPNCGQSYDLIRAGRGLSKPDLHLQPFPLLVEEGQVKVALPEVSGE